MGYMKISNLYKDITILKLFRRVYCLEKIHGTSANLHFRRSGPRDEDVSLTYFSGGAKLETFKTIFDEQALLATFASMNHDELVIFGEAYGGKQQKMSSVYGKELKFVAFEVKIGESFLRVPDAAEVSEKFALEFVHYIEVDATVEAVNAERDKPSTQARRNGVGDDKWSEGVVIRPIIELKTNNGSRLIVKHKRPEFRETKTPRSLDPAQQIRLSKAKDVAEEYVVKERLNHVMDKLLAARIAEGESPGYGTEKLELRDTGLVVRAMIEDVKVEEGDVIAWSKSVEKAIASRAAFMFKEHVRAL